MATTYPMNTSIFYVVEERLLEDLRSANFAWAFDTRVEAMDMLIEQVSVHGEDRFYTVFISID